MTGASGCRVPEAVEVGTIRCHVEDAHCGRSGGCLITGNEDGIKHCAMNILYSLQHLGYVIPAPADRRTTSPTGTPPS